MDNFFSELKRRHIYRVGAAYALIAWIALQLINNLTPALRLPDWASSLVVVLLFVGFPVTLLFAWMRDLPSADSARVKTATADWVLAGALIFVIALVSYQQFAPLRTARTAESPQTGAVAAGAPSAGAISIAVLPFVNLSSDSEQEFFSDGMTEEITSALANAPGLQVVGRTSAFQYKGRSEDLRSMGQALGATHLIEGSVRKAGSRVRITAQLILANSGTHLWTENYDRDLTDIFAVQENIAQAIVGALRVPLGLKPGQFLVSSRLNDPDAYQQYLRATALIRARALGGLTDAASILEQLVARYPDFAPAWGQLAQAYILLPDADQDGGTAEELRRRVDEFLPKAAAAAQRAIQLDPNLADAYASLGSIEFRRLNPKLAEEFCSRAVALDPVNPDGLQAHSTMLAVSGILKESLALRRQLQAVEPFVPAFNAATALSLWLNEQNDAAIEMAKALPPANRGPILARIYASMGRYGEAADALLEAEAGNTPEATEAAVRLLRTAPTAAAAPQSLPQLGNLEFVYLYVGASNRVLDIYERNIEAGAGANTSLLWHSSYAPVRKTERFKALMRKVGLVDYWRERGWPEMCRPVGQDDFACV